MIRRNILLGVVLAGIAVAVSARPVLADFEVQFSFGGATITVDAGTQASNNPPVTSTSGGASTSGASFSDSYNSKTGITTLTISNLVVDPNGTGDGNSSGFLISATFAKSNSPGSPNRATLSLSSLSIISQEDANAGGYSTLTIMAGDTGFMSPTGHPNVGLASTVSATASGLNSNNAASVVFNSYLDTSNAQFGTQYGAPTITLNPLTPGQSLSGNSGTLIPLSSSNTPYSITAKGQYTLWAGDELTDSSSGVTVTNPEPRSIALAGLGVLGVIGYGWRQRKLGRRPAVC